MHTSTGAEGHAPQHTGLPQLNTNDFVPQLVWLSLTFTALYMIMSRVALPRIADVIERRRDRIAADIDEAKRLGQRAQEAELAYKTALANAKANAHTIALRTREDLAAEVDAKQTEVDRVIAAKISEAEHRIAGAKQAAMKEVGTIATATTMEIVNRMIGDDVSHDELSNALMTAGGQ